MGQLAHKKEPKCDFSVGGLLKPPPLLVGLRLGKNYSSATLEDCSCEIVESIKDIGEGTIEFKMFRDW